jgi:hypothetical protein
MTIIAIDPGLSGGMCTMGIAGGNPELLALPFVGKELDVSFLHYRIAREMPCHVYIEQLGVRPRQAGVQTMIRNWQRIEDAAILAGASVEIVAPKVWQKGIVPTTAQGDRKKVIAAYCNYARKKYPDAPLILPRCRVIHDGMAAALCIADWAMRERTGA